VTAIPDKAVRKQIRKAVGKAPLVPLFESVIRRTAQRLKSPEGAEIELAFDKGVVQGAGGSVDLCEAELELKSGSPDAVVDVAEKLFSDEAFRLAEVSKADWGYGLAEREKGPKLAPVKASIPRLDKRQTCAEAFGEICRSATDQILQNWTVVLESDDPEGAHQMRIGLRRLRSAFKVFRPVVDSETLRALDRKARDLGRVLGELRDADVLATDIVDPAVAHRDEDADLALLKGVLAHSRVSHRQKVRAEIKERQWSGFKLRLAMLPESIEGLATAGDGKARANKAIGKLTGKALEKWWRRVAKSGRRLDKLTTAERHEMRKDLKTLRYAIEQLASLYPAKDVRRFANTLRSLQDMFGYLNDVVVAEKLKLVHTDGMTADPDLQRAVGYVIGWHAARAEGTWPGVRGGWRRLERAPKFWA
jgi:inorganic triphosphatase YgiF